MGMLEIPTDNLPIMALLTAMEGEAGGISSGDWIFEAGFFFPLDDPVIWGDSIRGIRTTGDLERLLFFALDLTIAGVATFFALDLGVWGLTDPDRDFFPVLATTDFLPLLLGAGEAFTDRGVFGDFDGLPTLKCLFSRAIISTFYHFKSRE